MGYETYVGNYWYTVWVKSNLQFQNTYNLLLEQILVMK